MIQTVGFKYEKFVFPAGEMQVKITKFDQNISMIFKYECSEDIIELLLVVDALKRLGVNIKTLIMPYIPFGRQDRVAVKGEAFSLKVFADLINSLEIPEIWVEDPHSDVAVALINNLKVVEQYRIFRSILRSMQHFYLISPDGGALKKIYKLAAKVNCIDVIECSKKRDLKTGEITETKVHMEGYIHGDCVIVDDICDGGRKFIEIAKALKKKNCGKVTLCVTHGIFSNGLEVFDGLIDEIYTREGKKK